jgi:ATPase subunit of ABC transporter with duplicated ATPase domains
VAILPEEQELDDEEVDGGVGKENDLAAQQAAHDYQQQMARQVQVQTAAAKLSQYMQKTQDAATRAATAQARVAKFLAEKQRGTFVATTVTVPKTPTVMRHAQKYVARLLHSFIECVDAYFLSCSLVF